MLKIASKIYITVKIFLQTIILLKIRRDNVS